MDGEREVGCYTTKDLAMKVWHFLNEISDNKNLEIRIKPYTDKCYLFDDKSIRLRSNGSIIHDKLDRAEYLRLINFDIPQTDMESMRLYRMKK